MFWLTVLFKVAICSVDEQHVSMRPQDSMTNLSKVVDPLETFQPSPLNVPTTQDALFYEENYMSLEPNPNPLNCHCQDVPPRGFLSCPDYVKRGWCHLLPKQYCTKSCWDCCIDSPMNSYISCQELKDAGYCGQAVKQCYCLQTCGRCEDIGERNALLELKNSIKFPNQLSTWTGWDVCSSWAGVNCTNNRVSTIALGNWGYNFQEHKFYYQQIIVSNAQTSIPKSFSLLSQLTALLLSTCGFSGAIPVELSVLTNLEAFDCAGSAMSGVFPPQFSAWKKIKFMGMGSNQMVGRIPAQYSEWKDMESWAIEINGFTGSLPEEYSTWNQILIWQSFNNDLTGSIPVQYSTFTSLVSGRFCDNTKLCAPSTLKNYPFVKNCPLC